MIGRVLWFSALALIAAITSIVQLDRQSRFTPELAQSVPEPFRAFAQAHIAAGATQADEPNLAVAEAKKLIARRPLPAEHLRVLAAAQFKAGLNEEAAQSIQVAAKRGWRDVLAQESVLRLAIAADDPAEATRRYTALLLSRSSEDDMLMELGPSVFERTGGVAQQTLAEIVAGGDRLPGSFLTRGSRVMPGHALVEVIEISNERGAKFDCRRMRNASNVLKSRKDPASDALEELVSRQC